MPVPGCNKNPAAQDTVIVSSFFDFDAAEGARNEGIVWVDDLQVVGGEQPAPPAPAPTSPPAPTTAPPIAPPSTPGEEPGGTRERAGCCQAGAVGLGAALVGLALLKRYALGQA